MSDETDRPQDAIATADGHRLRAQANNPTAVRVEINRFCRKPFLRALAWALFVYREAPHMTVKGLYRCLDECGVRSPADADEDGAIDRRVSWLEYYEGNEEKCEKDLTGLRDRLKEAGIPVNK